MSSGTRPLRAIAAAGVLVALSGLLVGAYIVGLRLSGEIIEPGWTSVMVVLLVLLGGLFIAVAVVAEYVGQAVRNTVGRPVYVRVDAPEARALHVLHTQLLAADGVGAADEVRAAGTADGAGEADRAAAGDAGPTADGAGDVPGAGGVAATGAVGSTGAVGEAVTGAVGDGAMADRANGAGRTGGGATADGAEGDGRAGGADRADGGGRVP